MPQSVGTGLTDALEASLTALDSMRLDLRVPKEHRDAAWTAAIHIRAALGYLEMHDCGVDLKTLSAGS